MGAGRRGDERGAVAILVASSLVLLVGLSAIAIDLSEGFNARRQDQTAADLTALAIGLYASDPQAGVTAALTDARSNLPVSYTNAEWETLWSNCTDPARPAGFTSLPAPSGWTATSLACISSNPSVQGKAEVRVRIPDQLTAAHFGQVIGSTGLTTSAVAHASLRYKQGGAVMPMGLSYGTGNGTQCLSSSPPALATYPCTGPTTGNFGSLNIPLWGNPDFGTGTTANCTPDFNQLIQNLAGGADHLITQTKPGLPGSGGPSPASLSTAVDDGWAKKDACTTSSGTAVATDALPSGTLVNTLETRTGLVFGAMQKGLIGDIDNLTATYAGFPPRLQTLVDSSRWVGIRERSGPVQQEWRLDNTPVWYYLREPSDLPSDLPVGIGAVCNKNYLLAQSFNSTTYPTARSAFEACLAAYDAYLATSPNPVEPLFLDSILENPRFVWAPEFHYSPFPTGNSWQPIYQFRPLYIDGLTFNCNATGGPPGSDPVTNCTAGKGQDFLPGQYPNGTPAKASYTAALRLDQVSSYNIPYPALSSDVLSTFPGNLRGPFEVQLTR